MKRSPGSKGKAGMKSNKTTNCSRLDLPARNLQGPACSKSSVLGLQHWPLMPAGTGSNELISNSLVMNPAAHCELPTERGWGFKSCESAKGSSELFKICNCMELGEQDELKKSFHWQSPCYTYTLTGTSDESCNYLGFLSATGQPSSRGFAGSGEWTEVGFTTDTGF